MGHIDSVIIRPAEGASLGSRCGREFLSRNRNGRHAEAFKLD